MKAEQALFQLSSLAADFKVGIVGDQFVVEMLTAIVDSMNVENKDKILARALQSSGIESVERSA